MIPAPQRKLASSTVDIRISALRALYKRTLKRKDLAFDDLIFSKVPHKLPIGLSQEEVVRLIDSAPNRPQFGSGPHELIGRSTRLK